MLLGEAGSVAVGNLRRRSTAGEERASMLTRQEGAVQAGAVVAYVLQLMHCY